MGMSERDLKDTPTTGLAAKRGTRKEQEDDAELKSTMFSEDEPDTDEDELDEEDKEETDEETSEDDSEDEDEEEPALLAGKFKSQDDLVKGYKELESKLGNLSTLEAKAAERDRLVAQSRQAAGNSTPRVAMPLLQNFQKEDGAVDVKAYDAAMIKWQAQSRNETVEASQRASQETTDMSDAERDFPYLKTDMKRARQVMALYRSGAVESIYEAAKEVDETFNQTVEIGKKAGSKTEKREMSKRVRSATERAGGRVEGDGQGANPTGELTRAQFNKLTLEQRGAYINRMVKSGKWGK